MKSLESFDDLSRVEKRYDSSSQNKSLFIPRLQKGEHQGICRSRFEIDGLV